MATLTESSTSTVLSGEEEVSAYLAPHGIWYRRFEGLSDLADGASDQEVLAAYREPIERLMATGKYRTADVINVTADLPGLEAMLAKFSKEHWHDEDEVRFIVRGRGLFHIHPQNGPVFSLEVEKGDMISVPRGTHHWFDLCAERNIRAIRLFEDTSGWTPHYTGSGEESHHQPLCFGAHYFPPLAM